MSELAAIDGHPRSSGIVAVTDVTIARMPASVFRTVIHAHADVCDQLLALLAEGKAYSRIADELGISYKTVANVSSQLKQKLGVRNLPELVRQAMQLLPTAS